MCGCVLDWLFPQIWTSPEQNDFHTDSNCGFFFSSKLKEGITCLNIIVVNRLKTEPEHLNEVMELTRVQVPGSTSNTPLVTCQAFSDFSKTGRLQCMHHHKDIPFSMDPERHNNPFDSDDDLYNNPLHCSLYLILPNEISR